MKTGIVHLPLHGGKAPAWLFARMKLLAAEIARVILYDFGTPELLRRLSDPFWFQAFGCILGFDWHSSGLTTTACGALKEGIKGMEHELGFFVAGGKGRVSRRTPERLLKEYRKIENLELPRHHAVTANEVCPDYLSRILVSTYERQPENFEALLGILGVGAKSLRSLSLLAELLYGAKPSFRDPARFSYAHGGKDGHPYPVDRENYDRSIHFLRETLNAAKIGEMDRKRAFERLNAFAGNSGG